MYFKIHRDCDTLRLRKVVLELYNTDDTLLDRRRLFAFPLFCFAKRLAFWQKRSLRCATIMLEAMDNDQ